VLNWLSTQTTLHLPIKYHYPNLLYNVMIISMTIIINRYYFLTIIRTTLFLALVNCENIITYLAFRRCVQKFWRAGEHNRVHYMWNVKTPDIRVYMFRTSNTLWNYLCKCNITFSANSSGTDSEYICGLMETVQTLGATVTHSYCADEAKSKS
jgi:hypothetical protein